VGCPYPSTGDVSYRSDESVEAKDFAWTPSHIRRNESVTTLDVLRAERITFWRLQHEDLVAEDTLDRLFLFVGTGTVDKPIPGWKAQEVQKVLYRDLEPGEAWTFRVEDYFDYKTLCDATLWIQNTETKNVHAKVVEHVTLEGVFDAFTIFDSTLVGKSIEPFQLHQPVTLPSRGVYREVTITNLESDVDAYVIALIGGWVGQATYLPADLPYMYGDGRFNRR